MTSGLKSLNHFELIFVYSLIFPGWEDPLEEGMATQSSFLVWRIPRTEEPGGRPSIESQSGTRLSNLAQTRDVSLFLHVALHLSQHNLLKRLYFSPVAYSCLALPLFSQSLNVCAWVSFRAFQPVLLPCLLWCQEHAALITVRMCSLVPDSLWPYDYAGSSVRGIIPARTLKWVAISFSRWSS